MPLTGTKAHFSAAQSRDENGVESFRFSGPKMETERKYENENGNLQKGNGNGIFMRKGKQKQNGVFRWNTRGNGTFCFRKYGISVSTIGGPTTKEHTMTQWVE